MRSGLRSAVHRLPVTSPAHFQQGTAKKMQTRAVLGLLVGVLVLTFMGCGEEQRTETTTVVNLVGDQEVPPRTTGGTGTATLNVDGQNQEIGFTLELRGQFTSPVQRAHIHFAGRGVNGSIFVFLCTNIVGEAPPTVPTPPPCPTGAGTVAGTLTAANFIPIPGLSTWAAALDAIMAGNTYVNVHTVTNSGGEIRGQVTP